INKTLTSNSLKVLYLPAIHMALGLAKKMLNCYYKLTDSSDIYCIGMVLHLRHKLTYFKNARWEPDWINTA
ncbi:hypothetical protein BV22DRAFT_978624, partial [Leucogyrophana mollusca]